MKAIIGYTGTVGQHLCKQVDFDDFYNSKNLSTIQGKHYDLLVIAAPSGNRLKINRHEQIDTVDELSKNLQGCRADRVVLISSVDVIVSPDSIYGKNRKMLEDFVSEKFDTTILRLATLIGTGIKKNIAYDLKHRQYDFINPQSTLQWTILNTLASYFLEKGTKNLVSEPIKNKDILDKFSPNLEFKEYEALHEYKMKPYVYTKQQVLEEISRYLK